MSPKGVQLSPLGFAACQSKNCTNTIGALLNIFGALLALASGKAERRQVHPLTNCTNTIGALLNIFGALETSAPPDSTPDCVSWLVRRGT